MIRSLFDRKIIVFLAIVTIIGFLIGYDYAVIMDKLGMAK